MTKVLAIALGVVLVALAGLGLLYRAEVRERARLEQTVALQKEAIGRLEEADRRNRQQTEEVNRELSRVRQAAREAQAALAAFARRVAQEGGDAVLRDRIRSIWLRVHRATSGDRDPPGGPGDARPGDRPGADRAAPPGRQGP